MSTFDLKIHTPKTQEDLVKLDFQKLWYDLREGIEGMDFSSSREKGLEHVTFGHLLAGYDMAYYAYLRYVAQLVRERGVALSAWCSISVARLTTFTHSCQAFAQDLFEAEFAENPRSQNVWRRYREGVLNFGGSLPDQIKMLEDYMGRKLNFGALEASLLNLT